MKDKNYSTLKDSELRFELTLEIKNFNSLQKKGSFSGLAIADRLERIQQEMEKRNLEWEPFYAVINVDIG